MADLPEKGTFVVQTVGPMKTIPNKKDPNSPWKSWSLQFKDDPQWYDTFWLNKEDPKEGDSLTGTKSQDEKWGYKFELERQGGKGNWNPAAAQATVFLAATTLVNGFLSIPDYRKLWDTNDPKLKETFDKYVATVEAVAKRVKESVVSMGALAAEKKTAVKNSPSTDDGDPGPDSPPPDMNDWPTDQEDTGL